MERPGNPSHRDSEVGGREDHNRGERRQRLEGNRNQLGAISTPTTMLFQQEDRAHTKLRDLLLGTEDESLRVKCFARFTGGDN